MTHTPYRRSSFRTSNLRLSTPMATLLLLLVSAGAPDAAELRLTESTGGVTANLLISKDRVAIPDKLRRRVLTFFEREFLP